MAITIYEPTTNALARTPILCKAEDSDPATKFEIAVRYWRGNVTSVPATAQFNLLKYPAESNSATFDISQLLQGVFDSEDYTVGNGQNSEISDGQVIWVECTYTSYTTIATNNVTGTPFIVYNGYGEFTEGANPSNGVLAMSQSTFLVNENQPFHLALTTWDSIEVQDQDGGTFTTITNLNSNTALSQNNLLYTDVSPSLFSGNYNGLYFVKVLDSIAQEIALIKVEVECEPRYEPVTIAFINKSGAWETMSFSKASKQSIAIESEEFMPYVLQSDFGSAATYNTAKPQIQRYDINGRDSITLNTTFLPEAYYETIKQIMMSPECVWYERGIGLNPKTMNMQKKSHINKEMVQYTIDFDYASLTQSTVR